MKLNWGRISRTFCPITDYELLLLIGGYTVSAIDDVELVSLDPDNNPVPSCLDNLKYIPVSIYAAAGSLDEDGLPFFCGGAFDDYSASDLCYKYYPQIDSWAEHGKMPSERSYSASAEVPGIGLVMAGSKDPSASSSVIATKDGKNFQSLQSLPVPTYGGARIQTLVYVSLSFWVDFGMYLCFLVSIAIMT